MGTSEGKKAHCQTPYKTMGNHSRTDGILTRAIPVFERSKIVNTSQVTAAHVATNFTLADTIRKLIFPLIDRHFITVDLQYRLIMM
jgi:hypothetical protein